MAFELPFPSLFMDESEIFLFVHFSKHSKMKNKNSKIFIKKKHFNNSVVVFDIIYAKSKNVANAKTRV